MRAIKFIMTNRFILWGILWLIAMVHFMDVEPIIYLLIFVGSLFFYFFMCSIVVHDDEKTDSESAFIKWIESI